MIKLNDSEGCIDIAADNGMFSFTKASSYIKQARSEIFEQFDEFNRRGTALLTAIPYTEDFCS